MTRPLTGIRADRKESYQSIERKAAALRELLSLGPLDRFDALQFFNDYRSKVPAQAIAGLGDQAYYDGSASLSVLKGSEYLRVAVIGVPNVLAAEKTLAQDVLPRM